MSANLVDSIPVSITQRAITSNQSLEEKGRREAALLNKDFYYGKQEQSLSLVNDDQLPVILNLTKPVIAKRSSMLYSMKPLREMEGPPESVAALEQIYKDNNIDALLGSADLCSELTGSALLLPTDDEEMDGGIRLRMYDASAVSVVANEDRPEMADAVSICRLVQRIVASPGNPLAQPQVQTVLKQQIWTTDSVTTYDGNQLISTETNELGFIPFVNFKGEEVHDQYLGHAPGLTIRMLNEDFNQLLTDLSFMIRMQAATPIAVSGWSGDGQVSIHPGRAFSLPAGATAEVMKTEPKIEEVLGLIKFLEEKMYETSSVPKVSVVGNAEASSGRELLIKWFPLIQVFREKAARYQVYELNLANTILSVLDLPPLSSLLVKFSDSSILPLSASDDSLEKDIEFSIRTPVDEVMRRDPELDETEAEAIVLANADLNERLGLTVSARDALSTDFLPGRDGRVPGDDTQSIKRELRAEHPDWDEMMVFRTANRISNSRQR